MAKSEEIETSNRFTTMCNASVTHHSNMLRQDAQSHARTNNASSLIVSIKSKMLRNLVPMLLKVLIYRSGERDPSSLPEIPGILFLGRQQEGC